jgi:hypothetical protein
MLLAALALVDVVCWQQLARLSCTDLSPPRWRTVTIRLETAILLGMIFCPHVVFVAQ